MTVPVLRKNSTVDNRFKIRKMQGKGSFGIVYRCFDLQTGENVTLKVGRSKMAASLCQTEAKALIHLFSAHVRHVPKLVAIKQTPHLSYLAVEQLGPPLSTQIVLEAALPLKTVLEIGRSMNSCLNSIHQCGYIHRDIKPGNFALAKKSKQLFIFDFAIARKFVDAQGNPHPPRPNPGFRGSIAYASPNAHCETELSPRDDYWGLLYSIIELFMGKLPWATIKDKAHVHRAKLGLIAGDDVTQMLPGPFRCLIDYLATVPFGQTVDYLLVDAILTDGLQELSDCGSTDTNRSCSESGSMTSGTWPTSITDRSGVTGSVSSSRTASIARDNGPPGVSGASHLKLSNIRAQQEACGSPVTPTFPELALSIASDDAQSSVQMSSFSLEGEGDSASPRSDGDTVVRPSLGHTPADSIHETDSGSDPNTPSIHAHRPPSTHSVHSCRSAYSTRSAASGRMFSSGPAAPSVSESIEMAEARPGVGRCCVGLRDFLLMILGKG